MTDDDLLHQRPDPQFGSGVIGVCDVCGRRQAVVVLQKERFQLCVLDFLNKTWSTSGKKPGAPLPPYKSERIWFPTRAEPTGKAPAIILSPTKAVKRPVVLVTPDVYGLTTSVLDGALRFAREGFEVVLPDLARTPGIGPTTHLSLRIGAKTRGGVPAEGKHVAALVQLFRDALAFGKTRELADPAKIGIFGTSYGASLALLVAAQEPGIGALALAYPMPIRPPEVVRVAGGPTLVVVGDADAASRSFVRGAQAALQGTPHAFEVVEVPGARHQFLARDLPGYEVARCEAAWGRLVGHLRQHLMPPPPKPPAPPVSRTAPPLGAPPAAAARSAAATAAPVPAAGAPA